MNEIMPEQSHSMPDDVLDEALAAIRQAPVPAGPPDELVNATLAALSGSAPSTHTSRSLFSRRLMMKTLSTTAGVLLAAGAAFLVTTALQSSSMAFTAAVEQLRSARTLVYTRLLTVEDSVEPIKVREYWAEDGRHRSKNGTTTTIFDQSGRIRLTLLEDTKTALVAAPLSDDKAGPQLDQLDWLQRLKKAGDSPREELGEKTIDGRAAVGFVTSQANQTFTIWVDATTSEIIRIEHDFPVEGSSIQRVTMTDFRFNQALDEALFSFEVPQGYTVKQGPARPTVPGGEESIIAALGGYTKLADGRFPASIADWGPWAVLFSHASVNGDVTEPEMTRVMGHLGSILPFLMQMNKDDYAYLGKGKTIKDTDVIVFWYKTKDETYRAIYGDLTVKEVTRDALPQE